MRYFKFNSLVILSYTFISLIVLLLNIITDGFTNAKLFCVYRDRVDILFIFRLFSHILGHTNLSHYLSNFFIVVSCGASVEEKYGSKNTLCFIGITAFIISIVHIALFDTRLLGASGIAYMLLALASFTNVTKDIPITSVALMLIAIARELYIFKRNDEISSMSHIVGLFCGFIFGFMIYYKNTKNKRRKKYVKIRNRRFYI